ncbi:diacylglycerol kinase family protein [Roseateles sp. SL47]|uniref:diacylglycerol/lipid kinase family protein n=1 Tax=Roseateles sp. SL47 TaxID=2995138 RepID=UPI00226F21B8|nr:diacylglycerol kinase family protein [Roseateles sp. SL47]WAC72520.1 diacylglycerol kinase family protein [Roseateles sp. SL47]
MAGPPLFVVFNLASGRGDREEVRREIESACAAHGRRAELLTVESPDQLMETAQEAVCRARSAHGVVVAAGGDGTLSAVAQATLGSGCPYGVLPRGTFNYFSRTHGISAEIGEAMKTLLEESPQPVQVGMVNGRAFLVNASVGLYPQLLEDRESWKQQFGRSRLVALGAGIATLLKGHRSLRLNFNAPDAPEAPREIRTPTLFVGNNALQMEQVGLPESRAIDQGQLAGVAIRPVSRLGLMGLLLRGALGRLGEADDLVDFSFRRLTVHARRFGRRRVKVATDGEIVWMQLPLTFELGPEPLMLVRPRGLAPERAAQASQRSQPSNPDTPPADAQPPAQSTALPTGQGAPISGGPTR